MHAFQDAVLVVASALAITGAGALVLANLRRRQRPSQRSWFAEVVQILLPVTALLLLLVAVWRATH